MWDCVAWLSDAQLFMWSVFECVCVCVSCMWWCLCCSNCLPHLISFMSGGDCVCSHWVERRVGACYCVVVNYGADLSDVCVWHSYACVKCRSWVCSSSSVRGLRVWRYASLGVCMSACVCRGDVPAFTLCQRKGSLWLQRGSHQETPRHKPWPCSQVRTRKMKRFASRTFAFDSVPCSLLSGVSLFSFFMTYDLNCLLLCKDIWFYFEKRRRSPVTPPPPPPPLAVWCTVCVHSYFPFPIKQSTHVFLISVVILHWNVVLQYALSHVRNMWDNPA